MRLVRCSGIVVLCIHVFAAIAAGQGLDRDSRRFVNDAASDLKSRDADKRVRAVGQLMEARVASSKCASGGNWAPL